MDNLKQLNYCDMKDNPYEICDRIEKEIGEVILEYNESGHHLAPNGLKSRLTEVLAKATRTPSFNNFFGDWINDSENSRKAIFSDTKEPMPFFHGTNEFRENLNEPLRPSDSDESHLKGYIFFTRNLEFAKFLGVMFTAFLNIRKPSDRANDLYIDWYPENLEVSNRILIELRRSESDGFIIHMDERPNEENTGYLTAVVKSTGQVLQTPMTPLKI